MKKLTIIASLFFAASLQAQFVTITNGLFIMGDALDGSKNALPHQVTLTAYNIEKQDVTYALWTKVRAYALTNGYTFDQTGSGKATNHPAVNMNWYDAVKWCNARSQMEGLTPCYYLTPDFALIYKKGRAVLSNNNVNWNANGYRLPTEAEWEKAARGGATGKRFPWTYSDDLSRLNANYTGGNVAIRPKYDKGPPGYNPRYAKGSMPYTNPAGDFLANDYGLYDMAGNVFNWCWDWYSNNYYKPGQVNPHGPEYSRLTSNRVMRGGAWSSGPSNLRCMYRTYKAPTVYNSGTGFRCVKNVGLVLFCDYGY